MFKRIQHTAYSLQLAQRAFTLLEVLMVIFIIGVLATWAISNYAPANLTAENQIAQTQLRVIYSAANSFKVEQNRYPANIVELISLGHIQDPNAAGNWNYTLSGGGNTVTVTAAGKSSAITRNNAWTIQETDGTITSINF